MDDYTLDSDINRFESLAVTHTWPEILRRITQFHEFSGFNEHSNAADDFDSLVSSWYEYRRTQKQAPNPPAVLVKAARAQFKDEKRTVDVVKSSFRELTHDKAPAGNVQARLAFMQKMLKLCELVNVSNFMEESLNFSEEGGHHLWQLKLDVKKQELIYEIRQRIRAFRMYRAGVTAWTFSPPEIVRSFK